MNYIIERQESGGLWRVTAELVCSFEGTVRLLLAYDQAPGVTPRRMREQYSGDVILHGKHPPLQSPATPADPNDGEGQSGD